MNGIIDRIILLILTGILGSVYAGAGALYIVLAGIVFASLCYYFDNDYVHFSLMCVMCILICIDDIFLVLLPFVTYEIVISYYMKRKKEYAVLAIAVIINVVEEIILPDRGMIDVLVKNVFGIFALAGITALSIYLSYMTFTHAALQHEVIRMRDDNEEFRQITAQKNLLLRQQQDSEVTLATLKERNRIAREIHDNVGHMLTRGIVQMGALQAMYKEEPLSTALKQVSETLNDSMTNIRKSVHDLHNEALDLRKSIMDICSRHNQYKYDFEYDMGDNVPMAVKYCLITIFEEAVGNAEKHSDGDSIAVVVQEHPAFYQMIINDNGHPDKISESGIGLHNMRSRVEELKGTISFNIDKGFRVFLTIPKESHNESNSGR